ncbi:MAG: phage virion morphogenesis protein [Rhodospirillum sp.]|nr:phage virion morphogenesis protein [Rhodospirillum sp.]MCF8500185.1 phage virion morphogenesis protein [Rhodospirillum sp.]
MTGTSIVVNRADIEAAAGRLEALANLDIANLLDEIGGGLVTSTGHRFETGVGPEGVQWEPSLRAIEQNGQTLVDRGHLRDSVTHAVNSQSVAIGTNVVYAAIHQFGGEAGRNHATVLPARPFLGISTDDNVEIGDIVADHLREGLGA